MTLAPKLSTKANCVNNMVPIAPSSITPSSLLSAAAAAALLLHQSLQSPHPTPIRQPSHLLHGTVLNNRCHRHPLLPLRRPRHHVRRSSLHLPPQITLVRPM